MSFDEHLELNERWLREGWFRAHETIGHAMATGSVAFADRRMTFAGEGGVRTATLQEIHGHGVALAGALSGLGLRAGDVLALQLPACIEAAYAYQAACALGLVVLPIVHIYGPAEVGFILRQSAAKALVIPDKWHGIDYFDRLQSAGATPSLEHVIVVGARPRSNAINWSSLEDRATLDFSRPLILPDDVHMLVYTSGSSAEPKGVMHSHSSLLHEARTWTHFASGFESALFFQSNPLGHMAGILATFIRPFVHGQQIIALDSFDVRKGVSLVEEFSTKTSSGVPFVLNALLEETAALGRKFPIERFVVGGGDIPEALIRVADNAGCAALRSYGSTEHPTVTGSSPKDPLVKRIGTDGRPMPGVSIRIVNAEGIDVDAGKDGEIWTIGPEQFIGYSDPALNAESFADGGWFQTGDLGHIDDDGYLSISGRKKDIIIRGGENISAAEVERVLAAHPAVREVAVAAAPDARYGQRVVAFVALNDDSRLDLEEIRRHFTAAGMARQKTPEALRIVSALPRTALGKVKKQELRERLTAEFA